MEWEDVERLALTDVDVNAWMHLYRAEKITREQMLCGLIGRLAEVKNEAMKALADIYIRLPIQAIAAGKQEAR